jgi:hypothetical protein
MSGWGRQRLLSSFLQPYHSILYRVSQEERLVFWEVIVSVILSQKKVYMYMGLIPNGFRDRAISLHSTLYRQATRHVLTSYKVH